MIKKYVSLGFLSPLLLGIMLAASCSESQTNVPAESQVERSAPAPQPNTGDVRSRHYARVSADGLRVRDVPSLSGEVLFTLDSGDRVLVKQQTAWEEVIAGLSSRWFAVSQDNDMGWAFGGYLSFVADDPDSLPVFDHTAATSEGVETTLANSQSGSAVEVPTHVLPIFGIEAPYFVPPAGFGASYDSLNRLLYLEIEELPPVLELEIEAPNAERFRRLFDSSTLMEFDYDKNGNGLSQAVRGVSFVAHAAYSSGEWRVVVSGNSDSASEMVRHTFEVKSDVFTIADVPDPDVFTSYQNVSFEPGSEVHLFIRGLEPSRQYDLLLYRRSGLLQKATETMSGYVYVPKKVFSIETDELGAWSGQMQIGTDLYQGEYRFARIENSRVEMYGFVPFTLEYLKARSPAGDKSAVRISPNEDGPRGREIMATSQ